MYVDVAQHFQYNYVFEIMLCLDFNEHRPTLLNIFFVLSNTNVSDFTSYSVTLLIVTLWLTFYPPLAVWLHRDFLARPFFRYSVT